MLQLSCVKTPKMWGLSQEKLFIDFSPCCSLPPAVTRSQWLKITADEPVVFRVAGQGPHVENCCVPSLKSSLVEKLHFGAATTEQWWYISRLTPISVWSGPLFLHLLIPHAVLSLSLVSCLVFHPNSTHKVRSILGELLCAPTKTFLGGKTEFWNSSHWAGVILLKVNSYFCLFRTFIFAFSATSSLMLFWVSLVSCLVLHPNSRHLLSAPLNGFLGFTPGFFLPFQRFLETQSSVLALSTLPCSPARATLAVNWLQIFFWVHIS